MFFFYYFDKIYSKLEIIVKEGYVFLSFQRDLPDFQTTPVFSVYYIIKLPIVSVAVN